MPPGETGRYVEIRFRDGEVMVGTVDGTATEDPGFFLVPADPGSNNLRVYVVAAATGRSTRCRYWPARRRDPARAAMTGRARTSRRCCRAACSAWLTR